uniref:Ribosomal protein S11 n=1 Tax=Rhodomonas salina TaxID=3034 RepID=Q9G8U5_RHDSA|nr:ribosomal protein S11 [Rhodomonas salina]AAG17752.1 ribosomal protein S11 [Rhodomonas salina]
MLIKNKFGIVHINNNTNNTLISFLTIEKKVLFTSGTGVLGLKKAKRSTSFASQNLAFSLGVKAYKLGIRFVQVYFKGFSKNRKSSLKGILLANLKVILIKDFTRIPFNGCKQRKKRRI